MIARACSAWCALDEQRVVHRHWQLDVAKVALAPGAAQPACYALRQVVGQQAEGGIVEAIRQGVARGVERHRVRDLLHAQLLDLHVTVDMLKLYQQEFMH